MKRNSLLLTAPRQLEWVPEELSELQPYEVLIQTRASTISLGTELPLYCGTSRHTKPRPYPYMTGYESLGTVITCGSDVQHLRPEDRVVAFYGHRTHAIVLEDKALLVPDDIPDSVALLAILSCDVAKGISKVAPKPHEPVLITGAGTIGLLTIFMLKAQGITTVDIVEPREMRRVLASRLGARKAQTPLQALAPDNKPYPVGIECSSRKGDFELLQSKMAHAGRICILADGNIEPLVLSPAFHEKELTIVGSSDGLDYQEHAHWFFGLGREHLRKLELLFDYQTTAENLPDTFENLANNRIMATKVVVWYDASNTTFLGSL